MNDMIVDITISNIHVVDNVFAIFFFIIVEHVNFTLTMSTLRNILTIGNNMVYTCIYLMLVYNIHR